MVGTSRAISIFVFLLAVLILQSCSSHESSRDDMLGRSIDSIMTSIVDTAKFNGNILVARGGKVVYQKSFGMADFYTKAELNDSSLFELASVSKQFTAMGIMMLKEQGRLAYEDDVKRYIPELPYEGMTIRHFLTHTSGIPAYEENFEGWDSNAIAFNEDMINLLAKKKPSVLFTPGEKWEYSNTAYAMLATIIERVTKKSYADFLQENIFTPLNMKRTRVFNTRRSTKEVIPNYAFGFVYSDSLKKYVLPDSLPSLHYVYTLDGIVGDGTVNSTTTDLLVWDQALYTEKLVKQTTLQDAYTPVKLKNDSTFNYGFGWGIEKDSILGKTVQHSGGWPGYVTYIKRYLEKNYCIILLTNNEGKGMNSALTEISRRLQVAQ